MKFEKVNSKLLFHALMTPAVGTQLSRVACAILSLSFVTGLAAQDPLADTFVTRDYRGRDVLRVDSQLEIPPAKLFGNLRVTITCMKGKSLADRDLTVVFYSKEYRGSRNTGFAYRKTVRLSEGQNQVVVDLPHTQNGSQFNWDVGLFEQGRDIEEKKADSNYERNLFIVGSNSAVRGYRVLAARDESMTDAVAQANSFSLSLDGSVTNTSQVGRYQPAPTPNSVADVTSIAFHDASEDWRRYLAYNGWIASAQAIKDLNQVRPGVAKALRTYVAAGGELVIHSADNENDLEAIEQLFGQPGGGTTASFWRDGEAPQISTESDQIPADDMRRRRQEILQLLVNQEFHQRSFLAGKLLVSRKELPDISRTEIDLVQRTNQTTSVSATAGIGFDGNWFWRNLIAAVGKPPVWTFCFMVALFGALLGPGLLYLTGRIGRRSLMIFLVPTISFVATVAIILYGIFHEGFDTHTRVTSVIMLDNSSEFGFAWSRQNFFSGLPPRDGLPFRSQTFVREVAPEEYDRGMIDFNPRKGVAYTVQLGEDQNWINWLKARQHQQLLVGHPIDGLPQPLAIVSSGDGTLLVKNCSSELLPVVVLRGDRDEYFFARDLAAGAQIELAAADHEPVAAEVARAVADLIPKAPPELSGNSSSLMDFGRRRNRYANTANVQSLDIINTQFRRWMSDKLDLPHHSYATLLRETDVIELPLAGKSSENLHLVVGVNSW